MPGQINYSSPTAALQQCIVGHKMLQRGNDPAIEELLL